LINKYFYRICNSEPNFWRNRYTKRYGEKIAEYKPDNINWKNYYLQTRIKLEEFSDKKEKFLFRKLAESCEEGNLNEVIILFLTGIDLNKFVKNYLGDLPDVIINNLEIFKFFLDMGLKLNKKHINYLLFYTAQIGELNSVKFLVEELGADVNYPNVGYYAYTEQHNFVVDYLIFKGGTIERTDILIFT
jgi:hypothetical protein